MSKTDQAIERLREMATDERFLITVVTEDLRDLIVSRDRMKATLETIRTELSAMADGAAEEIRNDLTAGFSDGLHTAFEHADRIAKEALCKDLT